MSPAVIIAKLQAQHHKMGVPDMLPGIGEMLGIVHNSGWEYFTTCN